jgi:mannosyltransferase OCH1-like enzyme
MIPRFIHQMWIPPSAAASPDLPADITERVEAWKRLHEGYGHKIWSLADIIDLCMAREASPIAAALAQCRFPAMQADIARLLLLREFGGYWVDLRLIPLQPTPEFLGEFDTVLTEHFAHAELPEPNGHLINGFIGAVPRSHILSDALDRAMVNMGARMAGSIFDITGPANLMRAREAFLLSYPERAHEIHVIPHAEGWGKLWQMGSASYNDGDLHWSIREKSESPFIDGAPLPGR